MCDQSLAFDQKLILLRLAAENGMIFENQACHSRTGFTLEQQGARKSADSATDDYAVISLPGINNVRRKRIIQTVTDCMTRFQNIPSVAIRAAVFADAAITSEVIILC